ncbi:MAG: hypothetical protein ACTHOP_08035 [Mesorhizobium sp.]
MTIKADIAYVVQAIDGGVVKVGVSGNPRVRVYGIKQAMPFDVGLVALVADGRNSERRMKEILAPWKVQGEWYSPRPELNDFLAVMRKENKLLSAMKVNDAFCEEFIKPAVLDYLGSRQPTMTDAGDLVFRFLRDGTKVVAGRMDKLHAAVKREIPASLLAGFVPLAQDHETPAVKFSEHQAEPAVAPAGEAA